ncbi:MAG: rhodanese-like domain-containing protein [bacterium]|nr:rhodanese-like domain-containing protein [bacterium]
MKNPFANLTWTQKAAGITLLLGVGALFLGNPYKGERVTMNMQDLALMVQDKSDHVTVQELADWLIQGKVDFHLIDVRTAEEYNEYHIPNAENISITDLDDRRHSA